VAVFESALTITCSDPQTFITSNDTKDVVAGGIADAVEGVSKSYVDVAELTAGRRLSVVARRLAGNVEAKFTVTFPVGHSKPLLTISSVNTTKLVAALQTRADNNGMNITFTGVTVQAIVHTTGGGTTKAPEPPMPEITSLSVRRFLSIGITTIAIMMSLTHGR
jgi:hypothetical protein